jgi:hypothetical protein
MEVFALPVPEVEFGILQLIVVIALMDTLGTALRGFVLFQ